MAESRRRLPQADEVLPKGWHGLDPAFIAAHQRDRLLRAMAEEVAAKGYVKTTVESVLARARISKKTFYEMFADRTDCFLAAYEGGVKRLMQVVADVYERMPAAEPERAREVLSAILSLFAEQPELARLCIVEVVYAGPQAMERFNAVIDALVRLTEDIAPAPSPDAGLTLTPERVTREALVGGILSVVRWRIHRGETASLPTLVPELTAFLLEPFIGRRSALRVAGSV